MADGSGESNAIDAERPVTPATAGRAPRKPGERTFALNRGSRDPDAETPAERDAPAAAEEE